jgi:serine/threonine-protein kinase RsbW
MSRPDATAASTVSLTIPAKAEYLVFCRLVLAGLAQAKNMDAETLADMKLAVTEACSNAVRHAYDDGNGRVFVRFTIEEDSIAIEVEDQGEGFEPPKAFRTFSADAPEAGMGLAIIDALTDELTFSAGANGRGSLVTFRKRV